MAKVKLNLDRLNVLEKVTLGTNVKTSMTGNANFTTPNPALATLGTNTTTLTTKNAAVVALQGQLKTAMTDRDAAEAAFDICITQLASYVENTSGGDPVKIASAGMGIKATATPVGALDMVQNVSITAGDDDGRLDLHWDPVRGVKIYELQTSTDPNVPANWRFKDTSSASRISLTGLTSGDKLWFRVRANAPKKVNDGAWSDPATKIVP